MNVQPNYGTGSQYQQASSSHEQKDSSGSAAGTPSTQCTPLPESAGHDVHRSPLQLNPKPCPAQTVFTHIPSNDENIDFVTKIFLDSSIRSCQTLTDVEKTLPRYPVIMGDALKWAAIAVENCEGSSASCVRQLAYCLQLVADSPHLNKLQELGTEAEMKHELEELIGMTLQLAGQQT
ncbi:hypothetical protein [Sansalvadorimonas verongulae]|uniref:hypothetical protein n=1 Tax=Sansalvadorimonas verongulae TaxID=2172824 RepID=UPI0012BCBF61|nr:hypothetical protein [Sansalvadorimonas verongulae]MTI11705.1 hypothetical protein [Sansalvadorimonas verongulae]